MGNSAAVGASLSMRRFILLLAALLSLAAINGAGSAAGVTADGSPSAASLATSWGEALLRADLRALERDDDDASGLGPHADGADAAAVLLAPQREAAAHVHDRVSSHADPVIQPLRTSPLAPRAPPLHPLVLK